jgi:DNA invertase Pin-like site-specific DNA recombinase
MSRLSRSRSGIQIWERVEAAGGRLHCAHEDRDTSTPIGRLIRDIHLANAVREREEHAERHARRREKPWLQGSGASTS